MKAFSPIFVSDLLHLHLALGVIKVIPSLSFLIHNYMFSHKFHLLRRNNFLVSVLILSFTFSSFFSFSSTAYILHYFIVIHLS